MAGGRSAAIDRRVRHAIALYEASAVAQARVVELEAAHKAAVAHHDVLVAQMSEHSTRRVAAEHAEGELKRERVILDGLLQRLEAAKTAQAELAELEPLAAIVDTVTAREREMDMRRRAHGQIEQWRAGERQALEELATATDILAKLNGSPDLEQSARKLAAAQDELAEVGVQLRDATDKRQKAEGRLREAREAHERAKTARDLDAELLTLADAASQVEAAREEWQELRGEKAEVQAVRDHDRKHRDALLGLGDTDAAECPTCHQPLQGTLGDLVAEYDESIAAYDAQLADIEARMTRLAEAGKQHKAAADRASSLLARREALGEVGDRDGLAAALDGAEATLNSASTGEHKLDEKYRRLAEQIPDLRDAVARAEAVAAERAQAHDRKTQAEQLAATYAKQLSQNGGNSYDAAAHAELKNNLKRTQDAVRRCAVLRESADSLQLLEGRVATQQPLVDELTTKVENLRAATAEVEVPDEAREKTIALRDRLAEELKQTQSALKTANDQVLMESAVVNAARLRLADGQKMLKRIDRETRELEIRAGVAKGLADYREHASRRARPALEEEASDFLSKMTGGLYSAVRLDESYLLKVADGSQLHPVRRFSGGEQDLAALCLRLALSRTLARQRGAEHGFIILDEVCGSQDSRRRELLLDQLGELARNEFHQIFVISHTDDVIEHCQKHIKVKRENGISAAEGPTT
jgi:exonuclease SbcC